MEKSHILWLKKAFGLLCAAHGIAYDEIECNRAGTRLDITLSSKEHAETLRDALSGLNSRFDDMLFKPFMSISPVDRGGQYELELEHPDLDTLKKAVGSKLKEFCRMLNKATKSANLEWTSRPEKLVVTGHIRSIEKAPGFPDVPLFAQQAVLAEYDRELGGKLAYAKKRHVKTPRAKRKSKEDHLADMLSTIDSIDDPPSAEEHTLETVQSALAGLIKFGHFRTHKPLSTYSGEADSYVALQALFIGTEALKEALMKFAKDPADFERTVEHSLANALKTMGIHVQELTDRDYQAPPSSNVVNLLPNHPRYRAGPDSALLS